VTAATMLDHLKELHLIVLQGIPAGLMIATQHFGVAGTIPTAQVVYSCVTSAEKDHQTYKYTITNISATLWVK
jgi:hypothetical protein